MGLYTKIIDLQKLRKAWEKVKVKKASPGIDGMTVEFFASQADAELKQLNMELKQFQYEPSPVRMITLQKGEKTREIGLLCLRDKIVQQSVAYELHRLYDNLFVEESYAFHSNRSALNAIQEIEETVKKYPDYWVLKADIKSFFDRINHTVLLETIQERIQDQDTLKLINMFLKMPSIDENGELNKNQLGIYQGGTISPLLSNIYLNKFDHSIRGKTIKYFRYADDILCICQCKEDIEVLLETINIYLKNISLELNSEKTFVGKIEQHFTYLGYEFSSQGKIIPSQKAINLEMKLEELWMQPLALEEKLTKGLEIMTGWEQYYTGKRKAESIFEFALELYKAKGKGELPGRLSRSQLSDFFKIRKNMSNHYPDICCFLGSIWEYFQCYEMAIWEYEQYWRIEKLDSGKMNGFLETQIQINENSKKKITELITLHKSIINSSNKKNLEDIMQFYMDIKCFNKAFIFQKELKKISMIHKPEIISGKQEEPTQLLDFTNENFEVYSRLFAGREDIYARESLSSYGKRCFVTVTEPITFECIKQHLENKQAVATYVQRNNATAHFMVFDLDISRKVLLHYPSDSVEFNAYLDIAKKKAFLIKKVLNRLGIDVLLEFSGYRGYHVWFFLQEWIPVRYLHMMQDVVLKKLDEEINELYKGISEQQMYKRQQMAEITVECFPNKSRVTKEKNGQCIKLPYMYHGKNQKQSFLIDEHGKACDNPFELMQKISQYNLDEIKRIIAVHVQDFPAEKVERTVGAADKLFTSLSPTVKIVLEKCSLMNYLCTKVKTTGYLTHFERQTILYVFGHLGEEGQEFVHQVMECTLNYQYSVTDRFLKKIPEKPISCIKLREQYGGVTSEIGCNCRFKRTKNCYPSPVLHAVKNIDDSSECDQSITMPVSRAVSKGKEKQIFEEINVHRKVQETAQKLLELKKQKRSLDKNIWKLEKELTDIFNTMQTDCIEIDMGVLTRKEIENNKYEWIIEL